MSEKEAVLSVKNEEQSIGRLTTMEAIKNKLYAGGRLTKAEAMELIEEPLEELCAAANDVRKHFCGNVFDVCTIINGKSGKCSENCKFCSQSRYYRTKVDAYSLIGSETIVEQAKYNEERGVLRYSIVTSGRELSSKEVDKVCESLEAVQKESDIALCGSFGLLEETEFAKLKQAGLTRVHNNLETSRRHFPNVCTTHTYDDKIAAIRAAQKAGKGLRIGALLGQGCVLLVLFLQRGHYLGEGERRQRLGHPGLVEVYQQALDGGRLLQVGEACGSDVGLHGKV